MGSREGAVNGDEVKSVGLSILPEQDEVRCRSQIIMGLRSQTPLDDSLNHATWQFDRRMGLYHNNIADGYTETEESETNCVALCFASTMILRCCLK